MNTNNNSQLKELIKKYPFAKKEFEEVFKNSTYGTNIIEKIKHINKDLYKKIKLKDYLDDIHFYTCYGFKYNILTINNILYLKTFTEFENLDYLTILKKFVLEKFMMREQLAKLCHQQWSNWMKYLFNNCERNKSSEMVIPKWAVDRWKRQMNTEYEDLSESEKNLDRNEADKIIKIISKNNN